MTTNTLAAGTLVREIDIRAPVAKVFAALTDPTQVPQWWGSDDSYRCGTMEVDFRVGGTWRTTGVGADGKPFVVDGEYRIIDAPHLVEFTWHYDWAETEVNTVVRYELTERGAGLTHLRVVHSGFADDKGRDDHGDGWIRVLAWLRDYVEGPAQ